MRNKYRVENGVVYMECTFEGKTVEVMFDEDKLPIADAYPLKWYVKRSDKDHYYVTGIIQFEGKQRVIYFHRFITMCPDEMVVDHINHNTIDNRMENLRVVTQQINTHNIKKQQGVKFREDLQKWRVRMRVDGRERFFGHYTNYEDAVEARKAAERKYRRHA